MKKYKNQSYNENYKIFIINKYVLDLKSTFLSFNFEI